MSDPISRTGRGLAQLGRRSERPRDRQPGSRAVERAALRMGGEQSFDLAAAFGAIAADPVEVGRSFGRWDGQGVGEDRFIGHEGLRRVTLPCAKRNRNAPGISAFYAATLSHWTDPMRSRVNWFVYLAVFVWLFLLLRMGGSSTASDDHFMMIGTWTDETGEPGNSIRFYLVERDLPGAGPIKAYDGHATLVKFLGQETAQATWNSGSSDPRVLNFSIGNRAWYIALRRIDDDHILVRFGTDPEEMYRHGALDHPDTKRLTRVRE